MDERTWTVVTQAPTMMAVDPLAYQAQTEPFTQEARDRVNTYIRQREIEWQYNQIMQGNERGINVRPEVTPAGRPANPFGTGEVNTLNDALARPEPVPANHPAYTETREAMRAMNGADIGYATILTALAYLLYKKELITEGDYQLLSNVEGHGLDEVVATIIQIADVTGTAPDIAVVTE